MSEWHPIPGTNGLYLITRDGRVAKNNGTETPRLLSVTPGNEHGHLRFSMTLGGKKGSMRLHRALALTFIPNPEDFPQVRHLDDNPLNNDLDNLAWGTQKQNMEDRDGNGHNYEASKTHCPKGHEYSAENTYIHNGKRKCKTCQRERPQYSETHPEQSAAYHAAYRERNREKARQYARDYRARQKSV